MPTKNIKKPGYDSLQSSKKNADISKSGQESLKPPEKLGNNNNNENVDQPNLTGPESKLKKPKENPIQTRELKSKPAGSDVSVFEQKTKTNKKESSATKNKVEKLTEGKKQKPDAYISPSEQLGLNKKEKQKKRDQKLLTSDTWLLRKGHRLTYLALYLFSIVVFYRPYELFPQNPLFPDSILHFQHLEGTAIYFAVVTLAIYFPVQYLNDGDFTVMSTEIKCILGMTILSTLSLVIAKDRVMAFETLTDEFIKAVLIFLVLVNVMRTRARLIGMLWLSMSVGIYLSYSVITDFQNGTFKLGGERVSVDIQGLFSNPNDMALHLVTIAPIAIVLGFVTKNLFFRFFYFMMAALFVGGIFVSDSRGGFLGIIAVFGVLAWKIGRKYRARVTLVSLAVMVVGLVVIPGNYAVRLLSIFIPGLDQSGSSSQRTDLLKRSILVSIRNPWGIGIGNFPVVGQRNLDTHNAFTQISSEIGILGLILYLIFLISPFRKLGAIERKLFAAETRDWFYYMSIGLQASIVAYMVSSFFLSVAYNWYVYYLIAYAVGFRRIYQIERKTEKEAGADYLVENIFGLKVRSV